MPQPMFGAVTFTPPFFGPPSSPIGLFFVSALLLRPPSVLSTFCFLFLSLGLFPMMPHFVKFKVLFLPPHGLVLCVQVYLAVLFPDLLLCLSPDRVDSWCLSYTHMNTYIDSPSFLVPFPTPSPPSLPSLCPGHVGAVALSHSH